MRHPQLPSPDDLPDADVMIFDGHCQFCTRQVHRIAEWDTVDRFAFLSLHDPQTTLRYPELTHDQMMEQMYLITRHGKTYRGAGAFRYLTRRLPRLWILAPLLHIPFSLPLWQCLYRQIAKRRYLLGGRSECDEGTCRIHFK